MLADALTGQAATVVVEAVVVTSHPVVVRVDVLQLAEVLSSAVPVSEEHVTYKSYPVVVLVQELVEELDREEEERVVEVEEPLLVGELVGALVGSSVGKVGSPAASNVIDGMFAENPRDFRTSAGGGGRMPGPVTSGITIPRSPPPPIEGQNQQFNKGMIGQPCES